MFFNRRKSISAVDFGKQLMSTCDKFCMQYRETHKNKYDIDDAELTIAHMWVVFHFINAKIANSGLHNKEEKSLYSKVITVMNTLLVKAYELSDEEANALMEMMMERYSEYKTAMMSDAKKDKIILPNWASAMAMNITEKPEPITDVFLLSQTTIHFNSFMKLINDLIYKQFKVTKLS
jgi:hypothetical protein